MVSRGMALALLAVSLLACAGRPAAEPERTETPVVTLTPTEDPDLANFGKITFGKNYDPDTLTIAKPITRFKRTYPEIAWSASLTDTVNDTSIEIIVARRSKAGVETTLISEEVDVSNPDSDLLANKVDLATLLDNKAGTYVMRYVRDGKTLAEGEFELVK
jgi:hypothetical protein